jgi:hypothetical protein
MTIILLVQGANLTFLGRRAPEIYGTTTAARLDAMLQRHAQDHDYHLDIFYTNIEGEAINRIYQGVDDGVNGLVMNPAGFTCAGYALKDCIKGGGLPYVEGMAGGNELWPDWHDGSKQGSVVCHLCGRAGRNARMPAQVRERAATDRGDADVYLVGSPTAPPC